MRGRGHGSKIEVKINCTEQKFYYFFALVLAIARDGKVHHSIELNFLIRIEVLF